MEIGTDRYVGRVTIWKQERPQGAAGDGRPEAGWRQKFPMRIGQCDQENGLATNMRKTLSRRKFRSDKTLYLLRGIGNNQAALRSPGKEIVASPQNLNMLIFIALEAGGPFLGMTEDADACS